MIDGTEPFDADGVPGVDSDATAEKPYNPYYYGSEDTAQPKRVTWHKGKRTVTPGQTVYTVDDALGLLNKLRRDKGAVDNLLTNLYYAGYYGTKVPVVGGDTFDRDAVEALYSAMDQANLLGGESVLDLVRKRAAEGKAQGAPLGTDPSKSEGASAQKDLDKAIGALQDLADLNGIKLSKDYIAKSVGNMAAGVTTLDRELQKVRNKFIAPAYPAWAEEIKSGLNMTDIAAPYQQLMATTLEIPDVKASLDDPLIQGALTATGKDGRPTYKSLWEFQRELRQDSRWQFTDNAYNEYEKAFQGTLSQMGL